MKILSLLRPSPKIQWIRKDGVLSESRTSKDSFDRILRFKNITESDSGEYQCTATNVQGIATHTYSITVEGIQHLHVRFSGFEGICLERPCAMVK